MDRRAFLTPTKKKPFAPDVSAFKVARTTSGLNPYAGPFGTNEVIHLLKRTMFGATKADIDYFKTKTLAQAVTELLTVPVTQRSVLDALEARYPMLRGTIRDHVTLQRRAFLRFFACQEDLSHESPDEPLPEAVASGKEPLIVIGAIAGG